MRSERDSSSSSSSGGVGFTGLLTVLFVGLKLTGFIAWSWFWVLSPIIFTIVLLLIILFIGFIYLLAND